VWAASVNLACIRDTQSCPLVIVSSSRVRSMVHPVCVLLDVLHRVLFSFLCESGSCVSGDLISRRN
jgi:hypothetical protein